MSAPTPRPKGQRAERSEAGGGEPDRRAKSRAGSHAPTGPSSPATSPRKRGRDEGKGFKTLGAARQPASDGSAFGKKRHTASKPHSDPPQRSDRPRSSREKASAAAPKQGGPRR